jgi:hypothetical protein
LASGETNVLTLLQNSGTDFWSLGLKDNGNDFVGALLKAGLEVGNELTVGLVIALGEVETSNVHAGINHLDDLVNIIAGLAEGADDLRATLGNVDSFEDASELDAS